MKLPRELRDRIGTYLRSVESNLQELPLDERQDVLENIESHIHDALERRCGGIPRPEDLEAVLAQMDAPESYAGTVARVETPAANDDRGKILLLARLMAVFGVILAGVWFTFRAFSRSEHVTEAPEPVVVALGTGPLLYFSFDTPQTDRIVDESGHGNDGEGLGPAWTNAGRFGGAFAFDGPNAQVRLPRAVDLGDIGDLSVSAWIRTSIPGKPVVHCDFPIHTWGRWSVRSDMVSLYGGSGHGYHQVRFSGCEDGKFHHLAAVYSRSASNISVYVDGKPVGMTSWDGSIELAGEPPVIGRQSFGGGEGNFSGLVDDLALFDRSLAPAEIALLSRQACGSLKFAPTLVRERYRVPHQIGFNTFAEGDFIELVQILGDRSSFVSGGTYRVRGRYVLQSRDHAVLAFFITTTGPCERTRVEPAQTLHVSRGSGEFDLTNLMDCGGYPHLSFYPDGDGGSSFGDLYFGQDGTVLQRNPRPDPDVEAPEAEAPAESAPEGGTTHHSPVAAHGLLVRYNFDSPGHEVKDASGNEFHGRVFGKPKWVQGVQGRALALDGRDDYVALPGVTELRRLQEGDYTVCAWFNPSSQPDEKNGFGLVVKPGADFGLVYEHEQRFRFTHYYLPESDPGNLACTWLAPSGPPTPAHQWYHVAGVASASSHEFRVYLNGTLANVLSPATTPVPLRNSRTWYIGVCDPDSWRWPAHGIIDDVRLYDIALPAEEIRQLYEADSNAKAGLEQSVLALAGELVNPDKMVRYNASLELARIGPPARSAVRSLIAAARDPGICAGPVLALGSIGIVNNEIISVIMDALTHESKWDRCQAAIALGRLNVKSARTAIEKATNDPDPDVRKYAEEALQRLNGSM
jgi:hypothetical protein